MRSGSLARVVTASLGLSVVITLGCGDSPPPTGPSPVPSFSVLSIAPTEGSSAGGNTVKITGTGFLIRGQAGATVTVDGRPVNASPSVDGTTINLTMPAHAAGQVDVTVIAPSSQAQATVPGGYTYVPLPPPIISELLPNIGSTAGGAPLYIIGKGLLAAVTVTVDGIVSTFDNGWPEDALYLVMPPHAAGPVEVIVTNRDSQTASSVFTYVPPGTLDFNGNWQGWAENLAVPSGSIDRWARLVVTIRDNMVASVSCSVCRIGENCGIVSAPSLSLAPPAVVANGAFSYVGNDGVSITGQILSPNFASGSINTAACGSRQWFAEKQQ